MATKSETTSSVVVTKERKFRIPSEAAILAALGLSQCAEYYEPKKLESWQGKGKKPKPKIK